jgi:signal transduction histidine kinase
VARQDWSTKLKTLLAILWFLFTFSLVTWWWWFSLTRVPPGGPIHRMFLWEGSILIAAVMMGGVTLIFFTHKDQRRHERLRFFFSTFSHDIKTSIARLRLQAEVLDEELSQIKSPILKRLVQDITRLELQLENSLQLSNLEDSPLFIEEFKLSQILPILRSDFDDLEVELNQDAKLRADKRALLGILKNIFQNSLTHGKADQVQITVEAQGKNLNIKISDNGLGFKGDPKRIGEEILRSQDSKGNGIGLMLSKRAMEKMTGDLKCESNLNKGFAVVLLLPGGIL